VQIENAVVRPITRPLESIPDERLLKRATLTIVAMVILAVAASGSGTNTYAGQRSIKD